MKLEKRQEEIIITMVDFFINEITDFGICKIQDISDYFNDGNVRQFKKMAKEYFKLNNATRTKAIKSIIAKNKRIIELEASR